MQGDISKWREAFDRFGSWDTSRQRKVQEREARVILGWLLDLKRDRYDILEIGCGNGRVGECIAQGLLDRKIDFSYCFSDLLPESVERARSNLARFPELDKLSFRILDIFEAEETLGKESQRIIVSTGFVSAATQRLAIPVAASLLERGGVLIGDFINHFSPAVFLSRPVSSIMGVWKYIKGTGKSYHLGIFGVRSAFGAVGLTLERSRTIRLRRNPIICMFRKTGEGEVV
jgi:SAM-dependent methyltransferase